MAGWIGVDFDGTLVEHAYPAVGKPVPAMVERVKRWLAQGIEVRVVTARANGEDRARQVRIVRFWCLENLGQELEVTSKKDYGMIELWDDRAVQVVRNQGTLAVDEAYRQGCEDGMYGPGYRPNA